MKYLGEAPQGHDIRYAVRDSKGRLHVNDDEYFSASDFPEGLPDVDEVLVRLFHRFEKPVTEFRKVIALTRSVDWPKTMLIVTDEPKLYDGWHDSAPA